MSSPTASPPSLSERLQTVTETLAAAHTQEEVFTVVLTPALQALNAVAGAVLLVDETGERLNLAATQGYEEGAQTLWQDGPLDGNVPAGDALSRREPLFFEQQGDLVRAYPELEARTGGIAAVATAVLPMFLDDAALGTVLLDFKEPHHFTPEEERFLRTLAAQCALALGRARSIEAQAQALRAWQGSHERLVLTLQAGGFGLWELDLTSGVLRRAPETMQLLGFSAPLGTVSEYLERIPPEDRPHVEQAFARAEHDGAPHFVLRHRFRRGDGREVWLEQYTQIERDGAGRAVRFVGVTSDVTERQRAEGQLAASEARFRRMVEASPVAIAAGDLSGQLTLVNDAYLGLLGYTRAEFEAGRIDWASLTPPEYHAADERAFGQAFERGASDPYEKEMLTKSGARLPLSVVLTRYEDGERQALVVGYLQDLRAQKAAERGWRADTLELERQVAARTAELETARARAEVLAALGDALQRATSPEEVADLALGRLGPALRAQSMLVVRVDGESIRLPTLWGQTPEVITRFMTRPGLRLSETPILHRAAQAGRGIYLDDYRAEPGTVASFPALAGGVEPILLPGGALEGFVVTWRPTGQGPWQEAERDLLRRAAGTLGLVLERAEQARQLQASRDEEQRRAQVLTAFAELSRDLVLETDPYTLIRRAQEIVLGLLPRGFSGYYEPEGGLWRMRSQVGRANTPELQAALEAGLPFEVTTNLLTPWRSGEPFYQDEYDPDLDHLTGSDEYPGASVTLPVVVGGQTRGVLGFALSTQRHWSGEDRAVLETVERQLTLALERTEHTRQLEEQREALAAFARFTEGSTRATDALRLAEGARDVLRATLGVQVGYSELEGGRWKGRVFSEATPPEVMEQARRGFPADLPSFARPFTEGDVVFVDGWDEAQEGAEATGVYGAAALYPYLHDGQPHGLLTMGTPDARAWTERERAVFRSVGRSLALAFERAEQNLRLEEEARAHEAFVAFTELVGSETNVVVLCHRAFEVMDTRFEAYSSAYYEVRDGLWKALAWTNGMGPELVATIRAGLPLDVPSFAQALSTRQPRLIDGWDAGREGVENTDVFGPVCIYPLVVDGEVRGIFTVGLRVGEVWQPQSRALMHALGRSLTLALERSEGARLLQARNAELDARTRALDGFADLTRDLSAETDRYVLIRRAQEVVLSLLPEGYAVYFEPEEGRWVLRGQTGELRNEALQAAANAGLPYDETQNLLIPYRTLRPYYQDQYARDIDNLNVDGMVAHLGASATLPVLVNGAPRGVFAVVLFGGVRQWTRPDQAVLESVVRSLGLALERAEGVALLAQRTRELERSNAELEQFAYVASHDLQAPIRAVTSFAGVIERRYGDVLDERGRLYLQQIVEGGEHMKRLVDDLLAFSRVHTERRDLRPVDAGDVFDRVARRLQAAPGSAGARITRGPLPLVLADAQQFDQLLQNLISNGLKYHREGVTPHVHVTAEREGDGWRFAVQDNGIGIEARYHERIFVIFQRLHGREEYEGTGIGLAVCKKIVERHGGRLWLESTPGQGSTFFFTLSQG